MSEQPLSGTERSRRFRYRERHGHTVINIDVDLLRLHRLIAAGVLSNKFPDRASIASAVEKLIDQIPVEQF